ncbi:MEDS domain-containing protein [Rhizocola hellebori]|nr:MEDS domain-containing protein [Rhizocola hellebori]
MPHSGSLGRHVCWAFDDPADFRLRAAQYLSEGMAGGARVIYIAKGDPELLLDDLSIVQGFRPAVASGAAQVMSIDSAYDAHATIDPAQQLQFYADATEQALADGHTGLRVAADTTSLVLTDANLDAFARYEHLADRYMVSHPLTALCAFDRDWLTAEQVAQLACMHPQASPEATQVRLYAAADAQIDVVLDGEIDMASHRLLHAALERADPAGQNSSITIDAMGVEFIDHEGVYVLSEYLSRRAATATVRCRPESSLAILIQLLSPPRLHLEIR